jgi:hypothetical protein
MRERDTASVAASLDRTKSSRTSTPLRIARKDSWTRSVLWLTPSVTVGRSSSCSVCAIEAIATARLLLASPMRPRASSTWTTLERHGLGSVRVGHDARRHRLRAVLQTVGASGLRRLHQLLIRPIRVALAGSGRRRHGKCGPHAFKDHGFAAVWIVCDVRGPGDSLILITIRRRVLVGLKQFLVRPVVVGHGRVARLHRLLRRGKRCTGGNYPGRQQRDCPNAHPPETAKNRDHLKPSFTFSV